MRVSLALGWALLLAFATPASAAPEQMTSIEGVTEYRLDNGLQVLLYPDASSTTATVNITYKVGSRHENYGEAGMAHLLEHLLFKGTPRHPDLNAEYERRGADANATTRHDRTSYFESFQATRENLEWALEMEADRMLHAGFSQKDLDSEMTVVRNEFENEENDPSRVLRARVLTTAYLWHNYGRSPFGARADIEGVSIDRLRAFYTTWYQPDNAVLIVSGRFDEAATIAYIDEVFGALPKPARTLPKLYTEEPAQDGEREVVLRRPGGFKLFMAAYHIPAGAHLDSAAVAQLVALLNDQPNGRVYRKLVAGKLAVEAGVEKASLHDPGYLIFSARLDRNADIAGVRKAWHDIVASLATEPFTQAELDRVRVRQQSEFEQLMNDSSRVPGLLNEKIAAGDWRLLFWDRDRMEQTSLADIQQAARIYLIESNVTIGEFIPEAEPVRAVITARPDLDALLAGYEGGKGVEAGESFDATPSHIEARVKRSMIGGIETAFLEKESRGGRVSGVLNLNFGTEIALRNKRQIGEYTAAMLLRGTAKHTRSQLEDELARLKTRLDLHGSAAGVSASFDTQRDNLPAVLELVAAILKTPAFPADDLDEIKRAGLAQIEASRTEPSAIARQATERYLSPYPSGHLYYVPTFDESAAAIATVTDLQAFHREFYGIVNAQAAFVGQFDAREVENRLRKLFGHWKSDVPHQRIPARYMAAPGKTETFVTPDKASANYSARANLRIRDDDPVYPALYLGNAMLGGSYTSRLWTRVREREGLSYVVGSSLHADSLDRVGFFSVDASVAPQNMGKLEQAIREEIGRALSDGFSSSEIASAKSAILQARLLGRSTDRGLAGELARHLYLGRTFAWDEAFERRIQNVTAEQIRTALRETLDLDQLFIVKAGDFRAFSTALDGGGSRTTTAADTLPDR